MKLFERFQLFTRAKQIAIVVVLVHFILLFALTVHHLFTYQSLPKKSIHVRNRSLPIHSPAPPVASQPIAQSHPPAKKKSLPPKTISPKTVKSQPAPQKTLATKKLRVDSEQL